MNLDLLAESKSNKSEDDFLAASEGNEFGKGFAYWYCMSMIPFCY